MASAMFRVRVGRSFRWASGEAALGPDRILGREASLDRLLRDRGDLAEAVSTGGAPLPGDARVVAPIGSQEVWAAGVTYLRSREARAEEATDRSPYDLVYEADRPELFFKSHGWRVVGPGEPVGIRADSTWDVPEPELVLVLDAELRIVAYTIGNDVSSRSIEGENTLYLPQAKTYTRSCSIGPGLVPASQVSPPFDIRLVVERDGRTALEGSTSTAEMKRSFEELAEHLGRAMTFPHGAFLLTGTGIVPPDEFTLAVGDQVSITIDGVGTLRNDVDLA